MINLLKADLHRILKEKFIYILAIVCVGVVLSTIGIFKIGDLLIAATGEGVVLFNVSSVFTNAITSSALIFAIAVSMFLGSDFKNKTMRFKLTRGFKRYEVYFASTLTSIILTVIFYIIACVSAIIFTALFFGAHEINSDKLVVMLLSLPVFIGMASCMSFVCLTCRRMSTGLIINIAVVEFLPSIFLLLLMSQNQTVNDVFMWIPYYSINMLSMMQTVDGVAVAQYIVGGVLLLFLTTGVGLLIFGKLDFK